MSLKRESIVGSLRVNNISKAQELPTWKRNKYYMGQSEQFLEFSKNGVPTTVHDSYILQSWVVDFIFEITSLSLIFSDFR